MPFWFISLYCLAPSIPSQRDHENAEVQAFEGYLGWGRWVDSNRNYDGI